MIRAATFAGWLAALVLILAIPTVAWGDRIVTTSGQEFVGTITEETPERVTIRTMSGLVPVPRAAIQTLEKSGAEAPPKIVPIPIDPAKVEEALQDVREAVTGSNWVQAGSLLEGLLKLDPMVFPLEKRLPATGILATCYLQTDDAEGAVANLERRAAMVTSESDKKRLHGAAEALNASTGTTVDGKPVTSYEELIAAAMLWKAKGVLARAVELAEKATGLDDRQKLVRAIDVAEERLADADLYIPGFSVGHKKKILKAVAKNILDAAHKAVEVCTEERKDYISPYWQTSASSVKHAVSYNEMAGRYLIRRRQAEDGLKNLQALAVEKDMEGLFDPNQVPPLLKKLEELEYHLPIKGMPRQLRISLRRIGGTGFSDR